MTAVVEVKKLHCASGDASGVWVFRQQHFNQLLFSHLWFSLYTSLNCFVLRPFAPSTRPSLLPAS